MRQLGWAACPLNLAYFLSLVSEDEAGEMEPSIEAMDASGDRERALRAVLARCDHERLAELQLSCEALQSWAMLAHKLQAMARDYEPEGSLAVMDVFHAIPLKEGRRTEDWDYLGKWKDFVKTEPQFHEVGKEHYIMLGAEHVKSLAVKLRRVLSEREL
jgi:thioesterase domain-containing protein